MWKLYTIIWKWKRKTDNWKRTTGNWKREVGNWKSETGNWKLGAGHWILFRDVLSGPMRCIVFSALIKIKFPFFLSIILGIKVFTKLNAPCTLTL